MSKSDLERVFSDLKKILKSEEDLLEEVLELEKKSAQRLKGKVISLAEKRKGKIDKKKFFLPLDVEEHPLNFFLYCDGASRGNPGPGSYAGIGQDAQGEVIFELEAYEWKTTNNRMELSGAIENLIKLEEYLGEKKVALEDARVFLYSDSKYVVDGIMKWIINWKKKNWKKSDGKEVENLDLWKSLDEQFSKFKKIEFLWVKGHAGHPQNEYCDFLANRALDEMP